MFQKIVQVTCGLDIDTYMGQLHFYQLTKEEKLNIEPRVKFHNKKAETSQSRPPRQFYWRENIQACSLPDTSDS